MHASFVRYIALTCTITHLLIFATADILLTTPAAGVVVAAGTIKVEWQDSDTPPSISELTEFTLSLMTGGNEDAEMLSLATFESQGIFDGDNSAQGTIPSGIAASLDNGFFFRMVSTKEQGGTVIKYSSRFSIAGLTGTTPLQYRQAVLALGGSTAGPAAVGASSSSATTSATATSVQASHTNTAAGQPSSQENSIALVSLNNTTTLGQNATQNTTANSMSALSPQDSGLSTSAIAGIAAGATVLGLAALASLIVFICIRRRRAENEVQEIEPQNPFLDDTAELSSQDFKPYMLRSQATELSSESMIAEAGPGERPAELDSTKFVAELEGSRPSTPYLQGRDMRS